MFLNLLTNPEKIAFLALARQIIMADNVISQHEIIRYKALKCEAEIKESTSDLDIETEIKQLPVSIEEVCKAFVSTQSRIGTLIELIGIGFVDGEFLPEERKDIYHIAQYLQISHQEVDGFIKWANDFYKK